MEISINILKTVLIHATMHRIVKFAEIQHMNLLHLMVAMLMNTSKQLNQLIQLADMKDGNVIDVALDQKFVKMKQLQRDILLQFKIGLLTMEIHTFRKMVLQ
jgi:3-isopropylmalate dehydratase small subunit